MSWDVVRICSASIGKSFQTALTVHWQPRTFWISSAGLCSLGRQPHWAVWHFSRQVVKCVQVKYFKVVTSSNSPPCFTHWQLQLVCKSVAILKKWKSFFSLAIRRMSKKTLRKKNKDNNLHYTCEKKNLINPWFKIWFCFWMVKCTVHFWG